MGAILAVENDSGSIASGVLNDVLPRDDLRDRKILTQSRISAAMRTGIAYVLVPFCITLAALSFFQKTAVVVGERDLSPGVVIRPKDVMTLFYKPRHPLPNGAFRCWLDCRDRVIGHKVVRAVEKYEPLTVADIN